MILLANNYCIMRYYSACDERYEGVTFDERRRNRQNYDSKMKEESFEIHIIRIICMFGSIIFS